MISLSFYLLSSLFLMPPSFLQENVSSVGAWQARLLDWEERDKTDIMRN